jgi:hypothetical protein
VIASARRSRAGGHARPRIGRVAEAVDGDQHELHPRGGADRAERQRRRLVREAAAARPLDDARADRRSRDRARDVGGRARALGAEGERQDALRIGERPRARVQRAVHVERPDVGEEPRRIALEEKRLRRRDAGADRDAVRDRGS